jgi:hypothetical protein
MTRKSKSQPPIPDPSVVLEVIRRTEKYDAACRARHAADPHSSVVTGGSDLPREPEWQERIDYLRTLSDECLAGLYALYRLGEGSSGTARSHAKRYCSAYSVAIQPCHRPHAAYDLAAKAPLANWLRRGLERLGLAAGPGGAERSGRGFPINPGRFVR